MDAPDTECPFCLAEPEKVRRCGDEATYAYNCRICGHFFDREFRFSRNDPTDWKDY